MTKMEIKGLSAKAQEAIKNIDNNLSKLESMTATRGVVHGQEYVLDRRKTATPLGGARNKDGNIVITIKV